MHPSSVVKKTQQQTSKAWFISMAHVFLGEMQREAAFSCLLWFPCTLLSPSPTTTRGTRPGKNGDKEKNKTTASEEQPHKISEALRLHVYPKGNKDQSWAQVSDQPYATETTPYISVVWGQCKAACSEPELRSALRDNLCQPPLPTSCTDKTVQGVGPSSLQSSPAASVLTNALQVLLLHHQTSNSSILWEVPMILWYWLLQCHRIIESIRLEKTSTTIQSNC